MKFFGRINKRKMARLIEERIGVVSDDKGLATDVIMGVFSDQQLRDLRTYWTQQDTKLSYVEDKTETEKLIDRVEQYFDAFRNTNDPKVFASHALRIAPIVRDVRAKFISPEGDRVTSVSSAMVAMDFAYVFISQESLGFSLTSEEEASLIATMIILRQSGDWDYYPDITSSNICIDGWITRQVLDNPHDVDGNIDATRDRISRAKAIGKKMEWELEEFLNNHDFMCDYPDDLIDRLHAIKNEDEYHLNRWRDLERWVLSEPAENTADRVNELLYFMEPYKDEYNVAYLFGTCRWMIRAHKFLPPMDDYSKADDRLREQCAALLKVNYAISSGVHTVLNPKYPKGETLIRDQRLIDMVVSRPDRAEEIATIIEERKTDDFDIISSIMSKGVIGVGDL